MISFPSPTHSLTHHYNASKDNLHDSLPSSQYAYPGIYEPPRQRCHLAFSRPAHLALLFVANVVLYTLTTPNSIMNH